jgi:hypothetical protein
MISEEWGGEKRKRERRGSSKLPGRNFIENLSEIWSCSHTPSVITIVKNSMSSTVIPPF